MAAEDSLICSNHLLAMAAASIVFTFDWTCEAAKIQILLEAVEISEAEANL